VALPDRASLEPSSFGKRQAKGGRTSRAHVSKNVSRSGPICWTKSSSTPAFAVFAALDEAAIGADPQSSPTIAWGRLHEQSGACQQKGRLG